MTNNEFSELLDKKLAGVATKKDIKGLGKRLTRVESTMATKEDLKGLDKRLTNVESAMVTKEDAKNFATKEDLEVVRSDVQKVEFQLGLTKRGFEQKLDDTFSEYARKMLDKFDQVIGELKIIREEGIFQQAQFGRLVERVERLEQHVGLQPLV